MSSDEEDVPTRPAASTAKPAMAQFLVGAGGSDSSDSDETSDDSSDDGGISGDEEEEPAQTRILSAQERRLAEMEATGKVMENGVKINDWVVISNGELAFPLHRSQLAHYSSL